MVLWGLLMSLCCLVYVSGRRNPTSQMNAEELRSIYEVSMKNNRKHGVTGLLLATARRFIQVLEGERRVVHDLFDRISEDPRHTNPFVRQSCTLNTRVYSEWSMNVVCVEHIGKLLYGIGDTDDDFDPYDLSQETLSGLLEMCSRQERISKAVVPQPKAVGYLD